MRASRLAGYGFDWKGWLIDCAYARDPEAWDARNAIVKTFRDAFQLDYAEFDVIQPVKNEFVVIDVNNTPGAAYKNLHFRELGVGLLSEKLGTSLAERFRASRQRSANVAYACPQSGVIGK